MGSTSMTWTSGSVPTSSPLCVSSSTSMASGSSSTQVSFHAEDEENETITGKRAIRKAEKQKSLDDIRLLAVSTHITELSYAISDIQTRIFEIQELRHKSQSISDTADVNTTSVIDQQLMSLDDRLEAVEKGVRGINETLEPLLRTAATPTMTEHGSPSENAAILRKHATLLAEWETVQDESETLREELKEDKWLTVFRTVTDQADGMMSSLEKAVNRCQEFIWQVHRRSDDFQSNAALRSDKPSINFEVYTSLLDSYEAKKKHYMPATSKVLSIIDKGVRDRVTKNGETLRRHAESAQKWKNLRDRITRTDKDMENIRKVLLYGDSDHESSNSGTASSKNGYLITPPSATRVSRISSTGSLSLSGSISPFRKIANRITGSKKRNFSPRTAPVSPLSVTKKVLPSAGEPSSPLAPTIGTMRRQRQSVLDTFRTTEQGVPSTPGRLAHQYSQSSTLDSYSRDSNPEMPEINATIKGNNSSKQRWNSSTRIENEGKGTIRKPPSRPPSSTGYYSSRDDIPPVPPLSTPYRRSASRTSMASSRPWSPITSSYSTTHSSSQFHLPTPQLPALRPSSRPHTPARAKTPSLSATPRNRPKTPSHIPGPKTSRSISLGGEGLELNGSWDNVNLIGRSYSPAFSVSEYGASPSAHPPRPPSRSMIPVPSVHLRTPSRPSSAMSNFSRSGSPTMMRSTFREDALRAQTPEHALRLRTQQLPVYQGTVGRSSRPSMPRLPPSSFKDRDGSVSHGPSRPGSRAGAYTPSVDGQSALPLHEYAPNAFDPLDSEVANIVNNMPHGLLVERVDAPLKKSQIPKNGEEIKAQYAFSNALSKKIVTCKLTTLTRSGKAGDVTTKKVMCRVGGGWQDLQMYILNRQAGSV